MKILLYVYLLVLVSCSPKTKNTPTNEELSDTIPNHLELKIYNNDSCLVSVFLDYEFAGEIQMFDKSHHLVKTIKNDIENENFVMFDLLEKNDSMFHVIAYWSLDNNSIGEGWVYKDKHLGIFSATYNRDFILYKEPYNREQIVARDKEYNPEVYPVTDFEGKWLKIKAKINNQFYQGWIPPEMQCSNVYSTCN